MQPILADRQRLGLHVIAWTLVGAMLALFVRMVLGTSWPDAIVYGLPMGLVASPISLSSWYVCRAMPLARSGALAVGVAALAAGLATAVVWAAIGRGWWLLMERMGFALAPERIAALVALLVGLGALAYLIAITVHYLVQAGEDSTDAARRALESQVAHRDAELRALRAQVDPHFLFNSLNSVVALIGPSPDKARQMCQLLADFLRDSLTLGSVARIPLQREVALAEQYLRIEHVRFGLRLQVRAAVAVDAGIVLVPPLILQPLVENAVRHGIATCLDGGTIEIDASRIGDRVVVVVTNPRDDEGARRGSGFGQQIVRRRLSATFGARAALSVDRSPEAYRASLTLPIDE